MTEQQRKYIVTEEWLHRLSPHIHRFDIEGLELLGEAISRPCTNEREKVPDANYRNGTCCYHCKHGMLDIRCGCYSGFWCKKRNVEVRETGICDEYEV